VLDVMGVVVASAHDEQLVAAARDEELTRAEEAQIAGAQVAPLVAVEPGFKMLGRLLRAAEVPHRLATAVDPDLADPVDRTLHLGRRVNDMQADVVRHTAAADYRPRRLPGTSGDDLASLQRHRVDGQVDRTHAGRSAGGDQRDLG
jgi:hypothetical protein